MKAKDVIAPRMPHDRPGESDKRDRRSCRTVWRLTSVVVGVVIMALVACEPTRLSPDPVVVIGVDGFEWNVILPLVHDGRLPTLARLMEEGSFGKLDTLNPALSPVIWTTVATGKGPTKHGIKGFTRPRQKGQRRSLYASHDRRTKALWNILSDSGRSVHAIGWWMTFPAEPINGVMVAQTNTRDQVAPGGPRAPWKGTVIPGQPGQVTPVAFQNPVMKIAEDVERSMTQLTARSFGEFSDSLPALSLDHWKQSLWSFRADNIYLRVAKAALMGRPEGPPDVLMVYFGMTDVVGHRFWRYAFPDEFDYPPTQDEIDGMSHVVPQAYVWVDRAIGELLAFYDARATVIIVSDHGMHAVNQSRDFVGKGGGRSGAHDDGDAGVIIVSGGHVQRGQQSHPTEGGDRSVRPEALPMIGRVHDVAPTVLALQDIPIGRDMDGVVLDHVLQENFLEEHPLSFVDTHDTDEWLANRSGGYLSEDAESERLQQLRSLGYIR